jgi:selenoprotein W-related protein
VAGANPQGGAAAVSGPGPVVEILYCRQCRWLLRAAWMAQELLATFEEELAGVTLRSGTGGVFVVSLDGAVIWSRREEGGFPDIVELKQRVRDLIAPGRSLGHADRQPPMPPSAQD